MSALEYCDPGEVLQRCLNEMYMIHSYAFWGFLRIPEICDEVLNALLEDETLHAITVGRFLYEYDTITRNGIVIEGLNQYRQICYLQILFLDKWNVKYMDQLPHRYGDIRSEERFQQWTLRFLPKGGREPGCCPWETEYRRSCSLMLNIVISTEDIFEKGKGRYYAEVPFVENDFPKGTMAVPTMFINTAYEDKSPAGRLLALLEKPYDPLRRGSFPVLESMFDYYREKMEAAVAEDAEFGYVEKLAKILAMTGELEGFGDLSVYRHMNGKEAMKDELFKGLLKEYLTEYENERKEIAAYRSVGWKEFGGWDKEESDE